MNTSKFSTRVSFGGCLISGRTACPCQECNLQISMDYCYFCQVRFPQSWIPRQIFPAENQATIGAVPSSSWPQTLRHYCNITGTKLRSVGRSVSPPKTRILCWSMAEIEALEHQLWQMQKAPPGHQGQQGDGNPNGNHQFWCLLIHGMLASQIFLEMPTRRLSRVAPVEPSSRVPIHFPNILSSGF